MKVHDTVIEIVRGSVLDQDVDAIVNAANTGMRGGGGVDGAIHRAAGKGLLSELEKVAPNGAETGAVVVTGGHNLKQPFILHTPGPVWRGGSSGESELLTSCYRSCLQAADARRIASIAFCSISTGIYGYPIDEAAPLALRTIIGYVMSNRKTSLTRVLLAMFGEREYQAYARELADRENAGAA